MIGESKFIKDKLEVTMQIGGNDWDLVEAKVTLSRNIAPNFVRIKKMAPAEGTSFSRVEDLIGEGFSLSVENEVSLYRDGPPGEYKSTLFEGTVANISSLGTGVYEAVIYDPSQQALNQTENGGSVMNQTVELSNPTVNYDELSDPVIRYANAGSETTFKPEGLVYRASEALEQVLEETELRGANDTEDIEIQLKEKGKLVGGSRGQFRGAIDNFVKFDSTNVTIGEALQKIANKTKSFWWFDRTGTFYFGVPDANVYYPELITDSSAGITTPPYQSIKVIGSDVASSNGYSKGELNPDEEVVVGGNITLSGSEPQLDRGEEAENLQFGGSGTILNKPTFTYRNQEIITEQQAINTLEKLAQDLGEQYANGKLTTVGFPEPSLFDVIVLPHANENLRDVGNYNERLPMGGSIFSVYKVEHMINPSDGFVSRFHVAGTTAPASVKLTQDDFVQNPGVSDAVEKEGEEFKGVAEPQTTEEVLQTAGSNAIEQIQKAQESGTAIAQLENNGNLGVEDLKDSPKKAVQIASENGLLEKEEEEPVTSVRGSDGSDELTEREQRLIDGTAGLGGDGEGGPTGIGPPVGVAGDGKSKDDEEDESDLPDYANYGG